MENTTAVVVSEPKSVAPTLFEMHPKQMISFASEMATPLADLINKQELYSLISGKKYVKVEGWTTLGTMLGFLPREVSVTELQDGSYEAKVELYSLKSGQVVGGASALCSIDEKRWGGAEKYARRSMAVTRATGKAYRLGFSWIMTLAGYEPTPFEEMPDHTEPKPVSAAKPASTVKPVTSYRSEPAPVSGPVTRIDVQSSGDFIIPFGKKHKGKKIRDVSESDLNSYASYLIDTAKSQGKPMSPDAQAFVDHAEIWVNSGGVGAQPKGTVTITPESNDIPF